MQDQNDPEQGHSGQDFAVSIINSIVNRPNETAHIYDATSGYVSDPNLYEPTRHHVYEEYIGLSKGTTFDIP